MPKYLQPSLSGGELSPGLRGRVDLIRYTISLGKARNVITKPTGGLAKRPGRRYRGRVKYMDRATVLLPFIYSTEVKYLVEVGDAYFRFWVDGALLTNANKTVTGMTSASPAVVTSNAHGYANGNHVVLTGLTGAFERFNGHTSVIAGVAANTFELTNIDATGVPAFTGSGTASRIVEVVTPYTQALIRDVRYTQSADVLYLFHNEVPIKELRRTTVNTFELVNFAFKRGPFRPFNADESALMAVSGTTGIVNVTTNKETFTPTMVGSLLYVEEKELRGIKPWASAEKNPPLGALRRSDSKVYKLVSTPTLGSVGTPYYVTGGVRPIHALGRAFDGPGDIKFDGVNDYSVGVEWEFVHNTFGILQITEYTSEFAVKALVIERVPDSIIGTAPAPAAGPWTFSGNDVTVAFSIPGATSDSHLDYRVTINGQAVQSNPNYSGGGGVGGGGGGAPRPPDNSPPPTQEF